MPQVRLPNRLLPVEYCRAAYFQTIPLGVSLPQALETSFWVHCHLILAVNDIIEIVAEDRSYDALIRLVRKSPGRLEWQILREAHAEATEAELPSRYQLKWEGPQSRWTVREIESDKVVVEGFEKVAALAEIKRLDAEHAAKRKRKVARQESAA